MSFNSKESDIEINEDLSFSSNKIVDLADPADAQDAATKNYVDNNSATYTAGTGLNLSSSEFSLDESYGAIWTTAQTFDAGLTANSNITTSGVDGEGVQFGHGYIVNENGLFGDELRIQANSGNAVTFGIAGTNYFYLLNNSGDIAMQMDAAVAITQNAEIQGPLDMTSNPINNVTDPSNAQDAATKNYVDNNTGGSETYSFETGHTAWSDGLSSEEVHRLQLSSSETMVVNKIDFRQKGGGSSSNVSVEVYDMGAGSTIVSQDLGGYTVDPGSSIEGGLILVRVSNSSGSKVKASITIHYSIE